MQRHTFMPQGNHDIRDTIENSILKKPMTSNDTWKHPKKKMPRTDHKRNGYKRHDKYSGSTSVQECIPTGIYSKSNRHKEFVGTVANYTRNWNATKCHVYTNPQHTRTRQRPSPLLICLAPTTLDQSTLYRLRDITEYVRNGPHQTSKCLANPPPSIPQLLSLCVPDIVLTNLISNLQSSCLESRIHLWHINAAQCEPLLFNSTVDAEMLG